METVLTDLDVFNFLKDLVEVGGFYKVDESGFVYCVSSGEKLAIMANGKPLPVRLYGEKKDAGEWVILNPFHENTDTSTERDWFYQSRSVALFTIIKMMMIQIAKDVVDTSNETHHIDYKKLELVSPYLDMIDKKTLKELDEIKISDIGFIHYNKRERTAHVQCNVLNDEFRAEFGNKVRKKTWEVVTGLLTVFLQSESPEITHSHKSTIIGIQEGDAFLHVFGKVLESIHQYANLILCIEMDVCPILINIDRLEKFHKVAHWFATPNKQSAKIVKPVAAPPWQKTNIPVVTPVIGSHIPPNATVASDLSIQQQVIQNTQSTVIQNTPSNVIPNVQTAPMSPFSPFVQQRPMFEPAGSYGQFGFGASTINYSNMQSPNFLGTENVRYASVNG